MSIKKLFDSADSSRNFLSDTNAKDAFIDVESERNVKAIATKQKEFVPQIDYSEPENFAKYGSAYLYYKSAIEYIHDYYPYDGSDAEINEFYNKLLGVERYVFNNEYPRTNGYALLSADGWGTQDSIDNGYGLSTTQEYITFYGGPNTSSYTKLAQAFSNPKDSKFQYSNVYDENIYTSAGLPSDYGSGTRESNLKSNFDNGVTVEFWLKKASFGTSLTTTKEVVFDMWNNEASGSSAYGRIRVELTGSGASTPFLITALSGTSGIYQQTIGSGLTAASLQSFAHYAFAFYNSGSSFVTKLYVDGVLNDTNTVAGAISELNSKGMMGRIGALLTASASPSGPIGVVGAGKLSASLDEFRFWNTRRNSQQISDYYSHQVRGGANSDYSNATLGIYFKFNEGIVGDTTTDSTVLDYSGRISNGVWTGYGSNSRTTSSAIVEAAAATSEYLDPIIYSTHPSVSSLKTTLLDRGTFHDGNNNNSFINLVPAWVIEEDEEQTSDLRKITHIAGAYFDKLYLQISAIPSFKGTNYTTASASPVPFAQHLPQSLGLYMPEIFVDSSVMEKFLNRNSNIDFEGDLTETKNLIYLNLYNSLAGIFKSKGTERAVRNIFRCFNIDDRIIKLKTYSNNREYFLKDNLKLTLKPNTSINLNKNENMAGVVYQKADPANAESFGYITGSYEAGKESRYGMTLETNVIFPRFSVDDTSVDRRFTDVSLFGMHEANTASADDTTWFSIDRANFQVLAVRDQLGSKNAYFKITSSILPNPVPELTSSLFYDVYDNENWHFSVRLKPDTYPLYDLVTGSSVSAYTLEFRGINSVNDTIENSFLLTASLGEATGRRMLRAAKRVYAGARRTNITGALLDRSDTLITNVKYWTRYLEDVDINKHLYDIGNAGVSNTYKNFSVLDSNLNSTDVTNLNSLALHWNFDNITGSDASGEFYYVTDISSGSQELRDNYGWVGGISGYQYTGYGYGFDTSSTQVVKKENINSLKFIDPEDVVSSTMIDIYGDQEKVFSTKNRPADFYHVIEKSMYQAMSEEMLNFFAGVIDFNNVIGAPVNRYRERYKEIEKLREIFFRKVTTVSNVEKFIDYYKWLDDAISLVVAQVLPASAKLVEDTYNIIESHVLERNKYKTPFPFLGFSTSSLETSMMGVGESTYHIGSSWSTLDPEEKRGPGTQKSRAQPGNFKSSGNPTVDTARLTFLNNISLANDQNAVTLSKQDGTTYTRNRTLERNLSKPYLLEITRKQNSLNTLKGGVNFEDNKNPDFTRNALYPAGPVNQDGGIFVPLNILVGFAEDIEPVKDKYYNDFPNRKIKRYLKTQHGRDWQNGYGSANVKSSFAFPFNIVNSTVTTGHSSRVVSRVTSGIDIVNVHNDGYGPDMEIPMQGPFTNYAVGGSQHRHIKLNAGNDDYTNRPEAWKILLGTFSGSALGKVGAIGMAGADYPFPEANDVGETPYPMTASQKAVFYRDHIAKRPVNIRNINVTTGSTILGNYYKNYEVVHSVGGYSNPRGFVKSQPSLPVEITQTPSASQARSILDIRRTDSSHYEFVPDYNIGYLTASTNSTVIRSRFSAPGSLEVLGQGYGDIRSNDYSVYNSINYRNLTVRRPYQNISGTVSEATGAGTTGIRVYDIHGNDFGLTTHLQRHAGRFGRDSLLVTSPGSSDNELPAFNKIQRNPRRMVRQNSAGTFYSASQFDNFFVQHQIPRADRQYSWVTGSLAPEGHGEDLRYYGFAPVSGPQAGYYSSSTDGYVAYFDFVSGSSVLGKAGTASIYQPTFDLNIYVSESVDDASDNNIGESLSFDVAGYYNTDLLDVFGIKATGIGSNLNTKADYFNLLMSKRKNVFGYRASPMNGPVSHPIIRNHRKNNILTIENSGLKRYTVTPYTQRANPITMGIDGGNGNIIIKSSYSNEKMYFANEDLNDILLINSEENTVTPFDQIVEIARQQNNEYLLNWVLYSETVFPSRLNEFSATATKRTGYDNLFWRDAAQDRYDLHKDSISSNSYGSTVRQSSWPLDAPTDFLTRTGIPIISGLSGLINSNSAGELQNAYFHTLSGSTALSTRFSNVALGGLYSRKHMLGGVKTVVSPAGVNVEETGSFTGDGFFGNNIQIGAGEALWEAATQAGVVIKSGSSFAFESSSSEPWFNNYDDFREDLKRITRGYAIVPEFRISENISDYEKYGLKRGNKFDTFEIVGTSINSSNENFYKDYSNSDFMREFLNIKNKAELQGSEIRLVCSASIRFNPYKGFYPAQRTLDLVSAFEESYSDSIVGIAVSDVETKPLKGRGRPLIQALFAPGLLYNTIKSGIAVEYPIVTSPAKLRKEEFYADGASATDTENAWMITTTSSTDAQNGYPGLQQYWDFKVPFETLIEPERHINNVRFIDSEPHPSASLDNITSSLNGIGNSKIYTKMASNFFAEIAKFFLKEEEYTTLKSETVTSGLRFESGALYGARLKLRKSVSGSRIYTYESGASGDNLAYGVYGAKYYNTASLKFEDGEFPLPQDPRQAPKSEFKENFTMYSRPTAFGPAVSGRPSAASASAAEVTAACPADSLAGFNWAYTPPYYNGEAWVDFVFSPTEGVSYDLERILSEIKTEYWRVDPGVAVTDSQIPTSSTSQFFNTQLLATFSNNSASIGYGAGDLLENLIYEGKNINYNAMQANASLNLFGIENVQRQRADSQGNEILKENESVGQRWVIQPKLETPMLNFNDTGVHPINSGSSTLTIPSGYGSGSVPRGIWHQFGVIEPDPTKGVFMEIGEIPNDWLKYHYSVLRSNSIYNNQNSDLGDTIYQTMKPLTDVIKFEKDSSSNRLGSLADSTTIKEAIVAIPYMLSVSESDSGQQNLSSQRKMFFGIDRTVIESCLSKDTGTANGDSLEYAGDSIRRLVSKMQNYILPPQFDFLNRAEVEPMVMYMFEFEYTFDRDDLSYIWQNIAPRNYKKITKTAQSTAHLFGENELLTEDEILSDDVRWMVFKVKQRSQAQYQDKIYTQAGGSSGEKEIFDFSENGQKYPVEFNWPYDYVSFVESVKFDVEILFKEEDSNSEQSR